jgi:hypothetical protein
MIRYLFLFSFLILSHFTLAQSLVLRIRVMSADSLAAVSFASVQINRNGIAKISDEQGFMQIDARVGDTLNFRAVGYFPENYVVYTTDLPPVIRVLLQPQSYTIKGATITGIRNKEELKQAIMRMRVPENPYADIPGLKTFKGPFVAAPPSIMNPISLIYSTDWAKRNRSKRWQKTVNIPDFK